MSQLVLPPPSPEIQSILDSRKCRENPHLCYKLSQGSQYGLDVAFSDALDIDENRMSIVFPFADGSRRDGVGDLLEIGGIRTERHAVNPICLYDHGKTVTLPIGLAEDPETREYTVFLDPIAKTATVKCFFYQGKGIADVDKDKEYDHAVFCSQLFDLMAKRYIRAGSIGYQVIAGRELQPDYDNGIPKGLHLHSVLMLEASAVVLPANGDSVRKMLCMGNVCGKPISPVLVKSLQPYAPEKKVMVGYEQKRLTKDQMPSGISNSKPQEPKPEEPKGEDMGDIGGKAIPPAKWKPGLGADCKKLNITAEWAIKPGAREGTTGSSEIVGYYIADSMGRKVAGPFDDRYAAHAALEAMGEEEKRKLEFGKSMSAIRTKYRDSARVKRGECKCGSILVTGQKACTQCRQKGMRTKVKSQFQIGDTVELTSARGVLGEVLGDSGPGVRNLDGTPAHLKVRITYIPSSYDDVDPKDRMDVGDVGMFDPKYLRKKSLSSKSLPRQVKMGFYVDNGSRVDPSQGGGKESDWFVLDDTSDKVIEGPMTYKQARERAFQLGTKKLTSRVLSKGYTIDNGSAVSRDSGGGNSKEWFVIDTDTEEPVDGPYDTAAEARKAASQLGTNQIKSLARQKRLDVRFFQDRTQARQFADELGRGNCAVQRFTQGDRGQWLVYWDNSCGVYGDEYFSEGDRVGTYNPGDHEDTTVRGAMRNHYRGGKSITNTKSCHCNGACKNCQQKSLTDLRRKYRSNAKGFRRRLRKSVPGTSVMSVGVKDLEKAKRMAEKSGLKFTHSGTDTNGLARVKLMGDDEAIDKVAKEYGRRMGKAQPFDLNTAMPWKVFKNGQEIDAYEFENDAKAKVADLKNEASLSGKNDRYTMFGVGKSLGRNVKGFTIGDRVKGGPNTPFPNAIGEITSVNGEQLVVSLGMGTSVSVMTNDVTGAKSLRKSKGYASELKPGEPGYEQELTRQKQSLVRKMPKDIYELESYLSPGENTAYANAVREEADKRRADTRPGEREIIDRWRRGGKSLQAEVSSLGVGEIEGWKETDSQASFRTDPDDAIRIAQTIARNRGTLGINDARAHGELVIISKRLKTKDYTPPFGVKPGDRVMADGFYSNMGTGVVITVSSTGRQATVEFGHSQQQVPVSHLQVIEKSLRGKVKRIYTSATAGPITKDRVKQVLNAQGIAVHRIEQFGGDDGHYRVYVSPEDFSPASQTLHFMYADSDDPRPEASIAAWHTEQDVQNFYDMVADKEDAIRRVQDKFNLANLAVDNRGRILGFSRKYLKIGGKGMRTKRKYYGGDLESGISIREFRDTPPNGIAPGDFEPGWYILRHGAFASGPYSNEIEAGEEAEYRYHKSIPNKTLEVGDEVETAEGKAAVIHTIGGGKALVQIKSEIDKYEEVAEKSLRRKGMEDITDFDNNWYCQECGYKFKTAKAAERASFGDRGCPKCGGSDIDMGKPQKSLNRKQLSKTR